MNGREWILSPTIAPDHTRKINEAQEQFDRFCDRLRIPSCAEAVTLYLTWLSEEPDATGRALKRTVAALDAARRLRGERPWTESTDICTFIHGLLRQQPIGAKSQQGEPLYVELVALLVQATMAPSPDQQRDRTAIALHAATGLSASALARLRWRDIRIRRDFVELTVPPPPMRQHWGPQVLRLDARGGQACPARVTRRFREVSPVGTAHLFGETVGPEQARRVSQALDALRASGGDMNTALERVSRSPRQIRDRALLLLGYGAALRAREAIGLTQGNVTVDPHGLLLAIDGRKAITGVPTDPGQPTDPVQAWLDWMEVVSDQGLNGPAHPAFPALNGTRLFDFSFGKPRLNRIVQGACERADLPGQYVFTSLRSGLIRTALRANDQAHDIAAHTDLRQLGSVTLHQRREHLLSRSVAGQLGL